MKYRADIDGLRALAIIPVILFHAGVTTFSGGFLGVDIFFVISGYLITNILLSDLAAGKFSIKAFYERRARRILPALFFVIALTTICAYYIIAPDGLEKYAQSAIAAIFSVSNILFWNEADYFNESGNLKPLLHTWSLGIEEQFYIFFPIGLWLIWKYARAYVEVFLIAGFILSLALAEFLIWRGNITGNFFLLPSRAWELLAGGYVAYRHVHRPFKVTDKVAAWLSGAGFVATLAAMVFFTEDMSHPGMLTLIPVVGAGAIIAFGNVKGLSRAILAHRLPVAIGLISYSLYLWHQPVFSLYRHFTIREVGLVDYAGLAALSVVLAIFTYRYVETPFRNRSKVSVKQVWGFSGVTASILLLVSGLVVLNNGYPGRFSSEYDAALYARTSRAEKLVSVKMDSCDKPSQEKLCTLGDKSYPPNWAIIGDSHAQTLGVSLDTALKEKKTSLLFLVQAGCAYLPGHEFDETRRKKCSQHIEYVEKRVREPDIHNVIFMNRYNMSYRDPNRRAAYKKSIEGLLAAGKNVYLVYPVPESQWNIPHQVFRRLLRGMSPDVMIDYQAYLTKSKPILDVFDAMNHKNLYKIRMDKLVCDTTAPNECVTQVNGKILYFDSNHLSVEGGDLVVQEILKQANLDSAVR